MKEITKSTNLAVDAANNDRSTNGKSKAAPTEDHRALNVETSPVVVDASE